MASKKSKQNAVRATFHGYIENTRDSLLLFEACKRGIIPRISRRLQDKERHLIKSGSIFCFDENESGIKRWTDGLVWSPSRILGNFLIYRELDDKKLIRSSSADYGMMHGGTTNIDENNNNEILRSRSSSLGSSSSTTVTAAGYVVAPDHLRRQREKALLGSLKNSYKFKRNGLIKKSMSLIVDGVQQHIISYYSKEDVLSNRLKTPSNIVELSSLEVSPGLCLRQNFRIPIFLTEEISDDRFMEEYQISNSKRKFSDFSSVPQYEMGSSPSSFTSSSSGGSSSNHLLSSIDNNQQPSQFFTTATKTPSRLYTPVTQNNSYSESRLNNISSTVPFNISMQPMARKKSVPSSSNAMYPAKDINYHDQLRLNPSQYNNHATQLNEQEQQATMMTNLMKKSFISMNSSKPEPHLPGKATFFLR
ncbi:Gti1/Pac2 family-domain-containing protein [Thamnidium elegans]|nr:Gti1/Pac2 family-domain-containing protein [Thamnidium elegans]